MLSTLCDRFIVPIQSTSSCPPCFRRGTSFPCRRVLVPSFSPRPGRRSFYCGCSPQRGRRQLPNVRPLCSPFYQKRVQLHQLFFKLLTSDTYPSVAPLQMATRPAKDRLWRASSTPDRSSLKFRMPFFSALQAATRRRRLITRVVLNIFPARQLMVYWQR